MALGVDDSTTYVEVSKVWATNPKTDLPWVASDFDPGYGFSLKTRHADTLWMRFQQLIIWASVHITKADGNWPVTAGLSDGFTDSLATPSCTTSRDNPGEQGFKLVYGNPWDEYPWTFWRFDNVTIPQGSTIGLAEIHFYAAPKGMVQWAGTTYVEDVDNSAELASNDCDEISSRPRTTAKTRHAPVVPGTKPHWNVYEITTELQEVISREGWASTNAFSVIWRGEHASKIGAAYAYEEGTNITYVTATWGVPSEGNPRRNKEIRKMLRRR